METENKIYLIDGNALCYRAYYAIRDLSTSKGEPTNAVYGFINIINKIVRTYGPTRMVLVFDTPQPTARHKKYTEYKIHRNPMPDDLAAQFPVIKEAASALGITAFEKPGYEADDVIATIAETAKDSGMDIVIVTSDKDAMQLVEEKVKVLSATSFGDKLYGAKEVEEKFGVTPDKITDLMALAGDASDNIPGVKGIGKVGASKLINEYGDIDALYGNIGSVASDSLRKKLIDGEQAARFSKELTVLDRHVPVDIGLDETFLKPPDEIRLSELYGRLEFKGLLKNIVKEKEDEREYPWTECASEKDMTALTARCSKSKNIFFDIMPVPEEEGKALAAILRAGGETVFVSFSEGPFKETFRCGIRTVLEDENIEKTGYDLKGQIVLLEKEGITLRGRIFDIMIADYLLDPSASGYDLPSITSRHLDISLKEETDPTSLSSRRVRIIEEIRGIVEPLLKEKHLAELFDDVEMPLVRVLAEMEANGVNVDTAHLKKKARDIESMLKEVTDRIYALAGEEFNINSPKQLQVILYEKLSLPAIKKTKTGVSTDESVLSKLASMHELPGALLEYREMNKLKTGYYDSLLRLAEKNNGRIHAFFNQAVTATGRLSSSDPNLQNIPVKTLLGQELRRAFVPESKGRVLITADYSQIELKILAHLSEDEKLIKAFRGGEDIHRATASEIFSQPLSAVTDEMRSAAKTVNFGVIYGISAFGLAKDLGIRVDQAQGFIGSYFARYGGIKAFIDRTVETTRETGYVLTLLNRRRYLPEIKSGNEHIRKFAERAAVNTAIQGSAADLIKLAMIECSRRLKGSGAKMIIQVHDELVFDVPEKSAERVSACVKEIMSGIIPLKVPLTVDVECGKNWFDTEPIG